MNTFSRKTSQTTHSPHQLISWSAWIMGCGICFLMLSVVVCAQSDAPPPSRYIGPIIDDLADQSGQLDPPASRYIGKIGQEPRKTLPQASRRVEQADNWKSAITRNVEVINTQTQSGRKIIVEVHVPGANGVQQVQHLSTDENRFFVPPKRVPLQAPTPLVDSSTGRAQLPSSGTVEQTSTKPQFAETRHFQAPTKTAQAPPALPETLEVERPVPVAPEPMQLPMPEPMPLPMEPEVPMTPVPAEPTETTPKPLPQPEMKTEQPKPVAPEPSPLVQPPKDPYFPDEETSNTESDNQSVAVPPAPKADYSQPQQQTVHSPSPMLDYECSCDSCAPMFQHDCIPYLSAFASFTFKGGNHRSLGDGRLFIPLYEDGESLLFADLRGQIDDHDAAEGNWGLGYREFIDPEWIFGVYAYYDLLRSQGGNKFSQATIGMELLSEEWDFRINGYFPEMGAKATTTNAGVTNGNIIINNMAERAHRGFDAELGKRILHWGLNDKYEVRWFAGGYHFNNSARGFGSFGGVNTRIEFRMYDLDLFGHQSRLEAGFEGSYDKVREELAYGFVRLRVPLSRRQNRTKLNPMRRRLADLVVRDIDIVSRNAINSTEDAINPLTGAAFGDLLQLTADDDFLSAIENSSENSVIVLDGSKGNFQLKDFEQIVLKDGQTLFGGGHAMQVAGSRSGKVALFETSGERATVESLYDFDSNNDYPVITPLQSIPLFQPTYARVVPGPNIKVANRTIVSGLDIKGGQTGVGGNAVSDVILNGLNIDGTNSAGISINDVQNLTIQNSKISNTASTGIHVTDYEGVTISHVEVDGAGGTGIVANNGRDLLITNSLIHNLKPYQPYYGWGFAVTDVWYVPSTTGISANNAENVRIGHNAIRDVNEGIRATGISDVFRAVGNRIELGSDSWNYGTGVSLGKQSEASLNTLIADNHIDATNIEQATGISVHFYDYGNALGDSAPNSNVTQISNNTITGLTKTAFTIYDRSMRQHDITIRNNMFEYRDIDSSWSYVLDLAGSSEAWATPLFTIDKIKGSAELVMRNNTFKLTGGGVNNQASKGSIVARQGAEMAVTLRDNSFPGEYVTVYRDDESTLNILSDLDNDFRLELADGSEPISGVEDLVQTPTVTIQPIDIAPW